MESSLQFTGQGTNCNQVRFKPKLESADVVIDSEKVLKIVWSNFLKDSTKFMSEKLT